MTNTAAVEVDTELLDAVIDIHTDLNLLKAAFDELEQRLRAGHCTTGDRWDIGNDVDEASDRVRALALRVLHGGAV